MLEGFEWRNGPDRHTTGIWMWSELFLHDDGDDKIAIMLVDTQGVFDNESTVKDNTVIFSLSTLISSVQIFTFLQI